MNAKRLLFRAAGASGALAAVRASAWRRERLTILCYHGIALGDEHVWNPDLFMSPGTFRARLQQLRDGGYNVLPLDDGVRGLYAGTLPPRSVALTFDDGFVDFAERAVPLLEEFAMPATVYLTTHYCERRYPVFDSALWYVLWKGGGRPGDLAPVIGAPEPLRGADAESRMQAYWAIRRHVLAHNLADAEQEAVVRRVAETLGVDYAAFGASGMLRIMSPEQVGALPRGLVDVELHTHRHRTPRDEALFRREIRDNRVRIERLRPGARPPRHFCYPSGDYDGAFLPWLRAEEVRSATTCVPGIASAADEPLLLPRFVDTESQSAATFEAWVSGFAAALPARRAYRLDPARLTPRAGPPVTTRSSSSSAGSP